MSSFIFSVIIILSILSGYATVYFLHEAFDVSPWIGLLVVAPITVLGVIAQIIFAVLIYVSIDKMTKEEKHDEN